jgi:uncharacterized protein YkwD
MYRSWMRRLRTPAERFRRWLSGTSSARRAVQLAVLAVGLAAIAVGAPQLLSKFGPDAAPAKKEGACPNAHAGPKSLDQTEAADAIQCLINKNRHSHGKGSLSPDGQLSSAAQGHSDHMVGHRCFAHECPGETGMASRIRRSGYLSGAPAWAIGENIAAGERNRGSPANIVQAWMNSPPHRANILSGRFEHMGVGVAHGTPSQPQVQGATYTVDFGYKGG